MIEPLSTTEQSLPFLACVIDKVEPFIFKIFNTVFPSVVNSEPYVSPGLRLPSSLHQLVTTNFSPSGTKSAM